MSAHVDGIPLSRTHASGEVVPGLEPVADAFAQVLADSPGTGAAFSACRGGVMLVDLWGGVADADTGASWTRDTLVPVFSQTKAWVAVCLMRLVNEGRLDLDAPMVRYWPEFGQAGKSGVRVRDVVSHTSLLPTLLEPTSIDDLRDPLLLAERLARQPLEADPRGRFLYHGLTYGWLCGELIRRIDGRSAGTFLREEICTPHGLELWIGLPPSCTRASRCSSTAPTGRPLTARLPPSSTTTCCVAIGGIQSCSRLIAWSGTTEACRRRRSPRSTASPHHGRLRGCSTAWSAEAICSRPLLSRARRRSIPRESIPSRAFRRASGLDFSFSASRSCSGRWSAHLAMEGSGDRFTAHGQTSVWASRSRRTSCAPEQWGTHGLWR